MKLFGKNKNTNIEDDARKELEYRGAIRRLSAGVNEIKRIIAENRHRAAAEEAEGQHTAALGYARMAKMLENTVSKMEGMSQRLELMHTMCGVGATLKAFSGICGELGNSLGHLSDPGSIANITESLNNADLRLSNIMAGYELLPDDEPVDVGCASNPEDEAYLNEILKESRRAGSHRIADLTSMGLDRVTQKN